MSKHHIEIHPENAGNTKSNPYMNLGAGGVPVTTHLVPSHIQRNDSEPSSVYKVYVTATGAALHRPSAAYRDSAGSRPERVALIVLGAPEQADR